MRTVLSRGLLLLAAASLGGAEDLLASPEISLVANVAKGREREPIYNSGLPPEDVLAVSGGRWVFAADRFGDGGELWVTDGTPAGTRQLTDLCPGPCIYRVGLLGSNGSRALFQVYSFTNPAVRGVWSTDGTREGTSLLRRFEVLSQPFQYLGSLPGSGTQFFTLCEPACALWRSDGTSVSTRKVASLGGESTRAVNQATIAGGWMFMTVTAAATELWVSDGTSLGTRSLAPASSAREASFVAVGPKVYFEGDDERLWLTDGTPSGTKRLHPTMSPSGAWALVGMGVCFPGYQAQTGWDLWCSEGSAASTRAWTQFDYFEAVRGTEDQEFQVVAYKNRRYFMADDGLGGYTLWSTDGTPRGQRTFSCAQCPDEYGSIAVLGSRLLIEGYQEDVGYGLFSSDGTPEGTARVPICDGCDVFVVKFLPPYAFLISESDSGPETTSLYRSDGTGPGTERLLRADQCCASFSVSRRGANSWWLGGVGLGLARLSTTSGTRAGTLALSPRSGTEERGSDPYIPIALGTSAFFCADPVGKGRFEHKTWFSSGPSDATKVRDYCGIARGAATSELGFWSSSDGGELTRSDGTAHGTLQLLPYATFYSIESIVALREQVGFIARDDYQGASSLHRSDGTPSGTIRVADLPGEASGLSNTGDSLHFFTPGRLWRTDLTGGSTQVLRGDVDDSLAGSSVRYGPLLLVRGPSRVSWLRADGSTALQPLVSDPSLLYNRHLLVHQHWAYFWGQSSESSVRVRLARLDLDQLAASGAAQPEVLAGFDLPTEAYRGSFEGSLVPLDDGRLAFTARDKKFGEELFVTDGTSSGTRRVSDVFAGPTGGVFSDPVPLGGGVVFAAHDGEHGVELWWSDGTSSGTRLIEDLRPGIESSSPEGFLVAGDRVYFSADDGKIGRELWVVEP